jgi:hypothetical protein
VVERLGGSISARTAGDEFTLTLRLPWRDPVEGQP